MGTLRIYEKEISPRSEYISKDGFGVKGKKAQTFPRPLEK
jgi:hypothetical protein